MLIKICDGGRRSLGDKPLFEIGMRREEKPREQRGNISSEEVEGKQRALGRWVLIN